MALVTRRWPWAVVVVALTILVAYLPPQPPREPNPFRGEWQDYPTREGRLAKRLGDDYRRAAVRLRIVTLRDSLMRVLAARGARPGDVTPLSPPRFDSAAGAITKLVTRSVRDPNREVRGALALVVSGPQIWGTSSNTYLPRATDGRTCIASHAIEATNRRPVLRYPASALGPCTFFVAFGLPGREVGRWLDSREYRFAWDADWTRALHSPTLPDELTLSRWLEFMVARATTSRDLLFPSYRPSIYWIPFSQAACATGNVDGCRRYFFGESYSGSSLIPGVISARPYYYSEANGVMSALVREQGYDRFARFWRSPLPPERAFDSAFTTPFSQWAPAWARSVTGPVRVDVVTGPGEIASTLLWCGVFLGLCISIGLARRVS